MNLVIYNVQIFTNDDNNTILQEHAVVIEGSKIKDIIPDKEIDEKYRDFKKMDCHHRLLMPGLINTHMHFYSTFARGLALQKSPQNFHEILSELWWKLDSALDLKSIYYSALLPVINSIKHGVTSVIDHHSSPNAIEGSLDKIEEAMDLLGLRGVLCYEMSNRNGLDKCQLALEENARYIQKCRMEKEQNADHPYDGMVGLHASFTLDDGALKRAAELSWATDRGCHIHVLEDEVDRAETKDKFDRGVVIRLEEDGILGEKSIAAHGIYLTENEMNLLSATDTIVVHNPQSNMNNAVGRTNIFRLMEKDILVGLGSDGMTADIKLDTRAANLLHKHDLRDANTAHFEVQKMVLKNNAKIFNRVSGQKVGRIEKDYLADIILIDYCPPTTMTGENFWGHFLYGISDAPVDTTIINGRIAMHGKQIAGLDEENIAAHARECADAVWQRFAKL